MYRYMAVSLLMIFSGAELSASEKSSCEFVIVVPSYNNESYAIDNLNSICWQKSTNPYHIIYINDCSPDKTFSVVQEYINTHDLSHKVTLINNPVRIGSGIANIYNAIHSLVEDTKIVVIVDGDDLLPHNNVLLTLENYYNNADVWMTYSKLQYYPSGQIYDKKVESWVYQEQKVNKWTIRTKSDWISALRTFRAPLFKKIKREDLSYQGAFMTVSWDDAFCIPMQEMCATESSCGPSHSVFIDEVLYLYRSTPINDHVIRKQLQVDVENFIREKLEPYEPLEKLL